MNSNLFELENNSQILKEEYNQKTQKLNSLSILFKKMKRQKKMFLKEKRKIIKIINIIK